MRDCLDLAKEGQEAGLRAEQRVTGKGLRAQRKPSLSPQVKKSQVSPKQVVSF